MDFKLIDHVFESAVFEGVLGVRPLGVVTNNCYVSFECSQLVARHVKNGGSF